MIPEIAIGAASLMAALIGGTWLSRWYYTPAAKGRHRAPGLPRVEALDKFEATCTVEGRPTVHVRFRLGGAMCLECRNTSTGGGVS